MLSVSRALPVLVVLAALLWQVLLGVSRAAPALPAELARADTVAALTAATAAVTEARALRTLWSTTEPLLALDQLRLERARYWLSRHGARLSAATHDDVAARIRAGDGAAALALLPPEAHP